jgi:hypothetical protein
MTVLADGADYPLLNVMWTMFAFFMWCIWIWLLISIFSDVFRRKDLSGWGKAGWSFLVLVLPFLGVFIYLISQGRDMAERRVAEERAIIESRGYVPAGSSNGHVTSQISEAKHLLDDGAITAEEFAAIKQKALAS